MGRTPAAVTAVAMGRTPGRQSRGAVSAIMVTGSCSHGATQGTHGDAWGHALEVLSPRPLLTVRNIPLRIVGVNTGDAVHAGACCLLTAGLERGPPVGHLRVAGSVPGHGGKAGAQAGFGEPVTIAHSSSVGDVLPPPAAPAWSLVQKAGPCYSCL